MVHSKRLITAHIKEKTMDIPDDLKHAAEELFMRYAKLFQNDFYTFKHAQDIQQQCIHIALELKELGFAIKTEFDFTVEKVPVSDDTIRTMITIKHDLALLYGMPPVVIATTITGAHAFGSIIPDDNLLSTECLPTEYEEYLHSLLSDFNKKDIQINPEQGKEP